MSDRSKGIESQVLLEYPGGTHVPDDPTEIRLFSKCRNEQLRLPAFLRHYRNIGVQRFFFVDNASNDGSAEYPRPQPAVPVFGPFGSLRTARWSTACVRTPLSR